MIPNSLAHTLSSLRCHSLSHSDGSQTSGLSAEDPAGLSSPAAVVQQELRDLEHTKRHQIYLYHTYYRIVQVGSFTPTCVVFPEPVSPTTSTTLLSLTSWTISSCRSWTGSERLKPSSSDGLLLRGTMGIPLLRRPLALFLSHVLSEGTGTLRHPVQHTSDVFQMLTLTRFCSHRETSFTVGLHVDAFLVAEGKPLQEAAGEI